MLKVPIASTFYLSSDSIYHPMNNYKCSIFHTFYNIQICRNFGLPFRTSLPWVCKELYRTFRNMWLQAHLACFTSENFSLVVHTCTCTKYRQGAFCMGYEAKSTEVKQATWIKPEVTRSWIYITTLSMSILWSAAWIDRNKIGISGF